MSEDCSICLLELNDNSSYTLECGHKFHSECIIKSLRHSTKCPYCRDDCYNNIVDDNDIVGEMINQDIENNNLLQDLILQSKLHKQVLKDKRIKDIKNQLKREHINMKNIKKEFMKDLRIEFKIKTREISEKYNIKNKVRKLNKIKDKYLELYSQIANEKNPQVADTIILSRKLSGICIGEKPFNFKGLLFKKYHDGDGFFII